MKKIAALFIAISILAGCATTPATTKPAGRHHETVKAEPPRPEGGGFFYRYSQSSKLTHAVDLLQKGDTAEAAKVLTAICNGSPVTGVTDEALFRLALLSLKPSVEKPASPRAQQLLKRLKKEFPASSWTVQATPLVELIGVAEEARHQNRNLGNHNNELTNKVEQLNRKVEQLNKNIEELKHLDLELEQKRRR